MDIKKLKHNWDTMGKHDPLWAILTNSAKKNNKWDKDDFFATGKAKITKVIHDLELEGITWPKECALDFGCGVGRLTQPLCSHFKEVHGVDIAPSMIERARQWNQYSSICTFHVNDRDDLSLFEDKKFDFIFSCIVLQHMQPKYARKYIAEFIRLLSPGGVAVFQVPSRYTGSGETGFMSKLKILLRKVLPAFIYKLMRKANGVNGAVMEMYSIPKEEIIELVKQKGARVVNIQADKSPGAGWESFQYAVKKS